MKKYIILFLLTSFSCVKTLGQIANCEVEYLNAYQPLVCPYKEEIFCQKTKLFMSKQKQLKKVRWDALGEFYMIYSLKIDSLGKMYSIKHDEYDKIDKYIEDQYAEKVLKHFRWDISMMKVTGFHDENNIYEIRLDVIVNRKRKVEIGVIAYGKYVANRKRLCE